MAASSHNKLQPLHEINAAVLCSLHLLWTKFYTSCSSWTFDPKSEPSFTLNSCLYALALKASIKQAELIISIFHLAEVQWLFYLKARTERFLVLADLEITSPIHCFVRADRSKFRAKTKNPFNHGQYSFISWRLLDVCLEQANEKRYG